jgi:hypothetical protein
VVGIIGGVPDGWIFGLLGISVSPNSMRYSSYYYYGCHSSAANCFPVESKKRLTENFFYSFFLFVKIKVN